MQSWFLKPSFAVGCIAACALSTTPWCWPPPSSHLFQWNCDFEQGGTGSKNSGEGGYFPCNMFRNMLIPHVACTGVDAFLCFSTLLHPSGEPSPKFNGLFLGSNITPPTHYIFPAFQQAATLREAKTGMTPIPSAYLPSPSTHRSPIHTCHSCTKMSCAAHHSCHKHHNPSLMPLWPLLVFPHLSTCRCLS